MKVKWKTIKGYEGIYLINTKGDIKSIKRDKLRKPNVDNTGYYKIDLYDKNHKQKTFKVHRLVALTFIPNPENKPEVNHIDGNRLNNNVNNLEWVTSSENSQHRIYCLKKNSLYPCKPVKCVELNKSFISITKASKFLNMNQSTISEVLNKPNRTAGGYHWKYI